MKYTRRKSTALFLECFWSLVDVGPSCWLWTGYKHGSGYGMVMARKSPEGAHRISFILANTIDVPRGMCIRHVCDTPACVNPSHLLLGTPKENAHDMWVRKRHPMARQTHCANGHIYDKANTYRRPNGNRDCRACMRDRTRKYVNTKLRSAA